MTDPPHSDLDPDSNDPAVTAWLRQMQQGESLATQQLWEQYYGKLVNLAKRRLEGRTRLVADEEDVALSAFKSFCRGAQSQRFPQLNDRDDLWKILVSITLHKVLHLVRDETRQKRGGNWHQLVDAQGSESSPALIEQFAGKEPTPEVVVELIEDYERLLNRLTEPELIELAILKMEGYTNREIALKWGKAERTVERKLLLIRQIWQQPE